MPLIRPLLEKGRPGSFKPMAREGTLSSGFVSVLVGHVCQMVEK